MASFGCNPELLRDLPEVIWCPVRDSNPCIYSGSPLNMVRQMAAEMGPNVTPPQAIQVLLTGLAYHRKIFIGLPEELSPAELASLFIYALLDRGVSYSNPTLEA